VKVACWFTDIFIRGIRWWHWEGMFHSICRFSSIEVAVLPVSSCKTDSAIFIAGLVNSRAFQTSSRSSLVRNVCRISRFAFLISDFISFLAARKRSNPPASYWCHFARLTALRLASMVLFHHRFDRAHNLIRRAF
jgi:hypothetical protein